MAAIDHALDENPAVLPTWVVFRCAVGNRELLAWCKLLFGPGFDEIVYTEPNGMGAPDLEEVPRVLGDYLFHVTVPPDEYG